MSQNQLHIVFSVLLAFILFVEVIGVNVIDYCCNICEEDGISAFIEVGCEGRHTNICGCEYSVESETPSLHSGSNCHIETKDNCSITRLQLNIENELSCFSHNLVVSVFLLPFVSLFKVTEVPRLQCFHDFEVSYPTRHFLSLFSTLLI